MRVSDAGLITAARPSQGPRPRYAGLPAVQKAGVTHTHRPSARNIIMHSVLGAFAFGDLFACQRPNVGIRGKA
ncbi:hypothetical protein GCM10027565_29400 [Bordetella tumulicola]